MVFEEKTLSSEKVFEGRIVNVRVDVVEMPDGKNAYRDIVEHPGGVGVLAITDDNKILMVKQFRKPLEKAIYEIPAGKLDKGEEPLVCGMRELEEETGYKAKEFISLGFMYPSPGFTDEVTYMFLAKGLYKGESHPDEDEFLEAERIPLDEAVKLVLNGDLPDAKTQVLVLKVAALRP